MVESPLSESGCRTFEPFLLSHTEGELLRQQARPLSEATVTRWFSSNPPSATYWLVDKLIKSPSFEDGVLQV